MRTARPTAGPSSRGRGLSTRLTGRGVGKKKADVTLRTDKDGDLHMGSAESRRGRERTGPARSGVKKHTSATTSTAGKPTKNGVRATRVESALARGLRAGDAVVKEGGRGGLEELEITGWKDSKAASNPSGGTPELKAFLERKATPSNAPPNEKVRISKTRIEGDVFIVSTKPENVQKILRLNNFEFAGAPLIVKHREHKQPSLAQLSQEGTELKAKFASTLRRRYNQELKLLDLQRLGTDPEFANTGMFATRSRQEKFFPAIMNVCNGQFTDRKQKREAIVSVTLANNELPDLSTVASLGEILPDIKNLDLSKNKIKSLTTLEPWRHKFRQLEHLILADNPIGPEVGYKDQVMKWFPTLQRLNDSTVRTGEEASRVAKNHLPRPILSGAFLDENSIAENFLKQFFPAYDADRATLATVLYNSSSKFSLNLNNKALRDLSNNSPVASWDSYKSLSRNLTFARGTAQRMDRQYVGSEAIKKAFMSLPPSKHPDLLTEGSKWLLECHTIPGLPDPSGQSPAGVGGLQITTHGEFNEMNVATGQPMTTRSFDRTFILGPGGGPGGVIIVSDMLTLRAHGGDKAFQPTATIQQRAPPQARLHIPEGFGQPAPGKSDEQAQKEVLVIQFSEATCMTLQYAQLCLEQVGWNPENAIKAFEEVKATLPPDAWFDNEQSNAGAMTNRI